VLTTSGGRRALVVSTTYFGHDALVTLELVDADGEAGLRLLARVNGLEALAAGTSVAVEVVGPVRAFVGGTAVSVAAVSGSAGSGSAVSGSAVSDSAVSDSAVSDSAVGTSAVGTPAASD
jgi:hypothetical protein